MGKDGSHPGREQEKRQAKEILGFPHPIQINLFEEFHAHSDPLELDTNDPRFVPEIELFPKNYPSPDLVRTLVPRLYLETRGKPVVLRLFSGSTKIIFVARPDFSLRAFAKRCERRTARSGGATKCLIPPRGASWPGASQR